MGGTISVQTQCCLHNGDEEWEEDDGESGEAQLVVEPVHWNGRPPLQKPANVPRSLSEATTIVPRNNL